jgi:hypothetical protein
MTIRIGDWIQTAEARVQSDVLSRRSAVVIPLRTAAVCGDDHVYDARQFSVCPNCASEERIPLSTVLGRRPQAVPRRAEA